jgi:hypothetical protein
MFYKKECEGCKYNSAGQRDHMGMLKYVYHFT